MTRNRVTSSPATSVPATRRATRLAGPTDPAALPGSAGRRGPAAARPSRRAAPSTVAARRGAVAPPVTRIAVALGGNAMIRRGESGTIEVQRHNLVAAADAIAAIARDGREIVLTHGNGPQVGFLAIEAEVAAEVVPPLPLDVLGAESQGQIGYLLVQALQHAFRARGEERTIATIFTQTIVAADDPGFANPTKPVGPVYTEWVARRFARERGWQVARDGKVWRRVVASPRPIRLVEAPAIRTLVDAGVLVIASGGGGVPVVEDPDGTLRGVEAVVDKDLAAVVLARAVGADALLLLTDVDSVYRNWGTHAQERVAEISVAEAEVQLAAGVLPAGSMAPKIRACVQFVRAGGRLAAIGALEDAEGILRGECGTLIV